MFPEITTREKKEHDEWCPKCNGIGLVRNGNYIEGCSNCFGKGIIKACECGNKIEKNYYTHCKKCRDKHEEERRLENFNKANKIDYKDYDGLFLWNERVVNKEDLEEYIYDMIYDGEEVPTYIPATYQATVFDEIDLYDVVNNKCEDGYEDMESRFDYNSPKFQEAQKLVNKWLDENSDVLNVWYEDSKNLVILTDVIEKLKKEYEKNKIVK